MRKKLTSLSFIAFLGLGGLAMAQVTGVVNDVNNLPEMDTEVVVKGTTKVTYTDENGGFNIDAKVGDTLVINGKDYLVTFNNLGVIKSKKDNVDLDEVVVVGYGTQKKSDVTGAISQIKGDVLDDLIK